MNRWVGWTGLEQDGPLIEELEDRYWRQRPMLTHQVATPTLNEVQEALVESHPGACSEDIVDERLSMCFVEPRSHHAHLES